MAFGNINAGARAVNVKVNPLYTNSKTIQGKTLSNAQVKLTRYKKTYGAGTVKKNGQFKFKLKNKLHANFHYRLTVSKNGKAKKVVMVKVNKKSVKKTTSDYQKQIDSLSAQVDKLQNELATLQNTTSTSTTSIDNTNKINDLNGQINSLKNQIAGLSNVTISGGNSTPSNNNNNGPVIDPATAKKIEKLQGQLKDVNDQIAATSKQLQDVGSQTQNLNSQMQNLFKQKTSIFNDLQNMNAILSIYTDDPDGSHAKSTMVVYEGQLQAAQDAASKDSQNKELAYQVTVMQQKIDDWKKHTEDLQNAIKTINGDPQAYKDQITEKQQSESSIQDQINDLQSQITTLNSTAGKLQPTLNNLYAQQETILDQINALQDSMQ